VTTPNFTSRHDELVPLPAGYGRQIRRRAITGAVLQILAGVVFAGLALLIVQWQRIPGFQGWLDPLWRVNIAAGWVPAVLTIGAAINAFRVPGALRGDAVHQPAAQRLIRSCRAWWLATLIAVVLLVIALLVGCVLIFREPGSEFAASDFVQFMVPLLTFAFGTILYLNVRYMLLRWPADLLRTWEARRRLPR
jgi:hypothetical protein